MTDYRMSLRELMRAALEALDAGDFATYRALMDECDRQYGHLYTEVAPSGK